MPVKRSKTQKIRRGYESWKRWANSAQNSPKFLHVNLIYGIGAFSDTFQLNLRLQLREMC